MLNLRRTASTHRSATGCSFPNSPAPAHPRTLLACTAGIPGRPILTRPPHWPPPLSLSECDFSRRATLSHSHVHICRCPRAVGQLLRCLAHPIQTKRIRTSIALTTLSPNQLQPCSPITGLCLPRPSTRHRPHASVLIKRIASCLSPPHHFIARCLFPGKPRRLGPPFFAAAVHPGTARFTALPPPCVGHGAPSYPGVALGAVSATVHPLVPPLNVVTPPPRSPSGDPMCRAPSVLIFLSWRLPHILTVV
jgi:hypothetical protein